MTLDAFAHNDEQLDMLADRLADRLATHLTLATKPHEALVDAREIARLTGRTRWWVYDHAGELGAVRLGSGPRPRLGFFPARVLERLERVANPAPLPAPAYAAPRRRPRPRPGYTAAGAKLLRVRGATPVPET